MSTDDLGTLSKAALRGLCIPLSRWVSIRTGPVSEGFVKELEKKRLDRVPVYDNATDLPIGLVSRDSLARLLSAGRPLSANDLEVSGRACMFEARASVRIRDLLRGLETRDALIVVRREPRGRGSGRPSPIGLVTISDLNDHGFRTAIFHVLAELEASLARLIRTTASDEEEWLGKLSYHDQAQLLGYWELAKRRDRDTGPLASASLRQLFQIAEKVQRLRTVLGFSSPSEMSDETSPICLLRNKVMHPVGPLVLTRADVRTVRRALESALRMHSAILAKLGPPEERIGAVVRRQ